MLFSHLNDLGLIFLAALVGGVIGFERESHGQAAGLRTNILVCMGSCLLMLLSLHMEEVHRHLAANLSVVRTDPARIASYAIASMGFLGAGAIITGQGSVRGLTTAASLWIVTALGLSIGAGYIIPAIFSTLICLLILYCLRRLKPIVTRVEYSMLTLSYRNYKNPLEQIKAILSTYPINIQFINFEIEIREELLTYSLRLQSKENLAKSEISEKLLETEGLNRIIWVEGTVP